VDPGEQPGGVGLRHGPGLGQVPAVVRGVHHGCQAGHRGYRGYGLVPGAGRADAAGHGPAAGLGYLRPAPYGACGAVRTMTVRTAPPSSPGRTQGGRAGTTTGAAPGRLLTATGRRRDGTMTHGTAATDTGRARGGRPGTVSLALRPLGYLLVGLVWLAIWLVVVALGPGILVWIAVDGTMTFGEVAGNQPAESWVVAGLLVVPIVVAVWGPGVFWYLPCATWPPAALSFLYVIRSLLPRYAAERLSHSERAPRGTSLGPPTVGGVTLSLQPVRPTRLTDLLMKFYLSGWDIDGRAFLAML